MRSICVNFTPELWRDQSYKVNEDRIESVLIYFSGG